MMQSMQGVRNDAKLKEMLDRFELDKNTLKQETKRMSLGVKRKLAVVTAFMHDPEVLVLDEPTNHLDGDAKEELQRALREFRGTVVVVSHEPEFYQDWVTEVWNVEDWTTKIV